MSLFCRHNRFIAECPICSKGTVLDPNRSTTSPRRPGAKRSPGTRRGAGAGAATVSRGVYASAGPYDGGREVRLEKVPGGLRLASWHAGSLVRAAPLLALADLPGLLAGAAEQGVFEPPPVEAEGAASVGAHGTSPGRAGDLRDELRIERLDQDTLRIARWVMRPGRGWELQDAPVMLPGRRLAQALASAAAAGALSSEAAA